MYCRKYKIKHSRVPVFDLHVKINRGWWAVEHHARRLLFLGHTECEHQSQILYYNNLSALDKAIEVIFSLQRERGMSTGFKSEEEHDARLLAYYQETDEKIIRLTAEKLTSINNFDQFQLTIKDDIQTLRKQ